MVQPHGAGVLYFFCNKSDPTIQSLSLFHHDNRRIVRGVGGCAEAYPSCSATCRSVHWRCWHVETDLPLQVAGNEEGIQAASNIWRSLGMLANTTWSSTMRHISHVEATLLGDSSLTPDAWVLTRSNLLKCNLSAVTLMCHGVVWLWKICGDCVQMSYISNFRK
jgi:hypothetical protein